MKINKFFSEYPPTEEHIPFVEFRDENTNKLSSLLIEFDNAKGIGAALTLAMKNITDDHLNPNLVKLAFAIFLTHDKNARKHKIGPPPFQLYNQFVNAQYQIAPFSNPLTPDIFKGYELLSYFRNDYDFNEHHWHWHVLYPYAGIPRNHKIQRAINRQGELFLYMHSQMIARYNAELLSWDLNLLHAWGYDDILTFGYTPVPGLRSQYGARPPFQGWYENHSPHLNDSRGFPTRKQMIKWKDNIIQAIHNGFFVTKMNNGSIGRLTLTSKNSFNWVGIVLEAENPPLQEVKPNEFIDRELYGSVHNYGHNKFAEIGYHEYTSPQNPLGIMVTNFGSPRDPCFWLWHRHIDDFRQMIVNKYIHNLNDSMPNGVKITDLKIVSYDANSNTPKRRIATYLEPPQLYLNEENAKLNHEPYQWEITIESTNKTVQMTPVYITVRLFIAPAELIEDQRSWIEMDKFTHQVDGNTTRICRKDVESSVARKTASSGTSTFSRYDPLSLCGWPQRMMLPVGTPGGAPYVAFAMLTDDKLEKVST